MTSCISPRKALNSARPNSIGPFRWERPSRLHKEMSGRKLASASGHSSVSDIAHALGRSLLHSTLAAISQRVAAVTWQWKGYLSSRHGRMTNGVAWIKVMES